MGRFWVGVGLLVLFLALGVWVACTMDDVHQNIAQTLDQASAQTVSGNLDAGQALVRQARSDWEAHWNRTASVADHAPMDEIDALFAQLEVYGQTGQAGNFAAYCAHLAKLVAAVGEAHSLTWWNLM